MKAQVTFIEFLISIIIFIASIFLAFFTLINQYFSFSNFLKENINKERAILISQYVLNNKESGINDGSYYNSASIDKIGNFFNYCNSNYQALKEFFEVS